MKTEKEVAELAEALREAEDTRCLCECDECCFDGIDTQWFMCTHYSIAHFLYHEKGYRKTNTTDTVLAAEEHKAFLKDLLTAQKATAERVIKETAEAVIAEILASIIVNNEGNTETIDYDYTIETIKEIVKKYCVEVGK